LCSTIKDESLAGLKFGELPFKAGWQKKNWQVYYTAINKQYKNS